MKVVIPLGGGRGVSEEVETLHGGSSVSFK